MKKAILIPIIQIIILASICLAEDSPSQTIMTIISAIRASDSLLPIAESVSWSSAYNSLSEQEKRALNVKTPEDLRDYQTLMLKNPKEFAENLLIQNTKGSTKTTELTAEQKQLIITTTVRQIKELTDAHLRANFKVTSEEVKDDTATVKLKATFDDSSMETAIKLLHLEGTWKLAHYQPFMNPSKAIKTVIPGEIKKAVIGQQGDSSP